MLTVSQAHAKRLGTFGQTFDIIEQDLLESIQQKLTALEKQGILQQHQLAIQKKTKERLERPVPVAGVTKTRVPRVFIYDPSIHVPYDLKDNHGNIFVKANSKVNPLDYRTLNKVLLFIDGDDAAQVNWALKQTSKNNQIILVKGAPFDLMEKHFVRFYFDQGGNLVKKFGLQQVPARISQYHKTLKVEELFPEAVCVTTEP
jgi:conjugal transfer pilus assembly protein TraW